MFHSFTFITALVLIYPDWYSIWSFYFFPEGLVCINHTSNTGFSTPIIFFWGGVTVSRGISDAAGIFNGSQACERTISFVTAVPSEIMTMTAAMPCWKACGDFGQTRTNSSCFIRQDVTDYLKKTHHTHFRPISLQYHEYVYGQQMHVY